MPQLKCHLAFHPDSVDLDSQHQKAIVDGLPGSRLESSSDLGAHDS